MEGEHGTLMKLKTAAMFLGSLEAGSHLVRPSFRRKNEQPCGTSKPEKPLKHWLLHNVQQLGSASCALSRRDDLKAWPQH